MTVPSGFRGIGDAAAPIRAADRDREPRRAGNPIPSRLLQLVAAFDRRRLLLSVLFIAVGFSVFVRPTDIDFWWHLKTGELIARTGAAPTADYFSFTVYGQPWTAHEWLWELAIYTIWTVGGYALAAVISAGLVVLTNAILYRLLRKLGANELVAAALVVLAFALSLPSIGVRPRELTHLFLAIYLSQVLLYREGSVRRLWLLPPLMVLWVNSHGPFILGLGVLGLYVALETGRWLLRRRGWPRHEWTVGILTLAATAINPTGPAMLLYPFSYYASAENPSFSVVTEFRSPDFHNPLYLAFAASLLVFMLVRHAPGRDALYDSLLLVAFAIQAVVSVRHVPVYALVAAPLLVIRLVGSFPISRELRPVTRSRRTAILNWLMLLACLAVSGLVIAGRPDIASRLQIRPEPLAQDLPVGGVDYIESHSLPDPVFNNQPWGGYLIYRWSPQRRVFIDGRVDMYGPKVVRQYLDVVTIRPNWNDVLQEYGIQTILIEKDSALSTLLLAIGDWERVSRGDVEEVFIRKRGEP